MTWTIGILVTLLLLLVAATITDIRAQMIYNWNTYPGIVLGFVMRSVAGGMPAFEDSVKGFFVCGGLMLVCFVLFGLGGGDLKLIAMMGAFLGFERGVEALLWTPSGTGQTLIQAVTLKATKLARTTFPRPVA